MRNGLCLGVIAALILSARSVDAQVSYFYGGPAPAYSALVRAAFGALLSRPASLFTPQADGGGSDGSGDGSSGDGSSSDGTGDSADGGDAAAAAAAEAAAEDAPSVSDPATAPTTDPTSVEAVSPLDAIQSQATTDPRGGASSSSFDTPGGGLGVGPAVPAGAGGPVAPAAGGGTPPAGPVDITINAVIVTGAMSPWHAVQRVPGVRNVIVNGGIIAWGRTPLPGESPPGPQPNWLYINPDPQLVNGSAIPPVVPNIVDIRWLNCPIKVIENPDK